MVEYNTDFNWTNDKFCVHNTNCCLGQKAVWLVYITRDLKSHPPRRLTAASTRTVSVDQHNMYWQYHPINHHFQSHECTYVCECVQVFVWGFGFGSMLVVDSSSLWFAQMHKTAHVTWCLCRAQLESACHSCRTVAWRLMSLFECVRMFVSSAYTIVSVYIGKPITVTHQVHNLD